MTHVFPLKLKVLKPFPGCHVYLIGAGGLVGSVVITEVLVGLSRLRLSVHGGVRLIDRCDVVAQGDGLHSLVDATSDALADLRARALGFPRWSRAAGASIGGLGGRLKRCEPWSQNIRLVNTFKNSHT